MQSQDCQLGYETSASVISPFPSFTKLPFCNSLETLHSFLHIFLTLESQSERKTLHDSVS